MVRKWISMVLAVCLLLTALPALADDTVSASTTLYGSSYSKRYNIEQAVWALDGTTVEYGETFSFNETIGPRTKEAGYVTARNGRGSRVTGGGVSQLATTLCLAAEQSNYISIQPYDVYGDKFREWYVDDGDQAVVTDYDAGTDFCFTSWYDGVLTISAWMDEDNVYCSLDFGEGGGYESNDCISRATTPVFGTSGKRSNIELAAASIDGTQLSRFEWFSFNKTVGPRTKEAGYVSAINGRGVNVIGGGVAQVASTIYLAVKDLSCIEMDEVKTYGKKFTDGYVSDPAYAVVTDYNAGTDFSFNYTGYGTLTILLYIDGNELVCEILES